MLALILSALLTGHVLTDTGEPVAGAVVSDMVTVVQTDETGAYEIPYRDNTEFVFVSTPSGYDIPLDATGSPHIYRRVSAAGAYDFTLHKQEDGGKADSTHVMIVFADPQPATGYDLHRFLTETVEDVKALKASYPEGTKFYGLSVGDITWDWYDANDDMKTYYEAMGFPNFMVIGNHDHNCNAANQNNDLKQDSVADNKFTKTWGPNYYSFNVGNVHYVVLDNMIYIGHNGDKSFITALTAEQNEWLRQDLELVPNGTAIMVGFHVPSPGMSGVVENLKKWMNKGAVVQHFVSGHTHTNSYREYSARLIEHTLGAVKGAFWSSHWATEGSPNGYMVFEANGKKGFDNWYWKATGYPWDYQIRTFPVNSIDAGNDKQNCILADIWSIDSKGEVYIYENGVKHIMSQFTGIDPMVYDVMREEADKRPNYPGSDGGTLYTRNPGAAASNHMFFYEPEDPNANFIVEYIDRFGHVFTAPVLKHMMVASFDQNEDGTWTYSENFDELCEYPNQHSATLAKGTFVQGHYPLGWYACTSGSVMPDGTKAPSWATFNWYRIGEGSHTASGFYNFGNGNPAVKSQNSTYRSIGSLNDASNKAISYGVLIENNTGHKITSVDVSYTGKVWRVGTSYSEIDTLSCAYMVISSASSMLNDLRDRRKYIGEIRANDISELMFTTPSTLTASVEQIVASPIDGDSDANQTRLTATIPATLQPGDVLMLRWMDKDETGEDQALAIDDILVTATVAQTQDIDEIVNPQSSNRKYIQNGQLIIIKNGKTYNILGAEIK